VTTQAKQGTRFVRETKIYSNYQPSLIRETKEGRKEERNATQLRRRIYTLHRSRVGLSEGMRSEVLALPLLPRIYVHIRCSYFPAQILTAIDVGKHLASRDASCGLRHRKDFPFHAPCIIWYTSVSLTSDIDLVHPLIH
jgi:hypothetical protein